MKEGVIPDHGDGKPESHSRLRWLDSQIAEDNGVIPPYTSLEVDGNSIRLLGRELVLNSSGLPEQIIGSFTPEMTGVGGEGTDPRGGCKRTRSRTLGLNQHFISTLEIKA